MFVRIKNVKGKYYTRETDLGKIKEFKEEVLLPFLKETNIKKPLF